MKKIHYAWYVCIGCALLLFCTSGLSVNAFSIYQPYIISLNNFSNTQASTMLVFRYCTSLASMFLVGRYYKKAGMRTGLTIAGGVLVLAFLVYGLAVKYWHYCLASSLAGIGYGTGTMIPITILLGRWFRDKKATAVGICSASTGVATLGIPSLLARSVETRGMRFTFCAEAAATLILVFICWCILRNSPEEKDLAPYGADRESSGSAEAGKKAEVRHDLHKAELVIIVLMTVLVGGVMNVSYSHLTVLITGEGFPESTAAVALSVSGLSLMLGKITYGRAVDRWGSIKCNRIFAPLLLAGFAACCLMGKRQFLLYPGIFLYSFGIAYLAIGLSTWPSDLSSPEKRDRLIQILQIGYASGSLLFSSLPGVLADRAGGSYTAAFWLFFALEIIVFAAVQAVLKSQRKRENGEQ